MSILVNNLVKVYGEQRAVNGISFEAKAGEILGFLGPNGAGKSTTMKIATCYLPPTSGEVFVCGHEVSKAPIEVRKKVGYLPENNPLYLDMYVHEYLLFIASLHGLSGKRAKGRVQEMVTLVGLQREQHKKIGMLSKGYRQRVGLAQALVHDPEVLILDEPTTGLDPNQLLEIRQVIKKISQEKTVIFSTHIMQEVQALCDRVVIVKSGQIVANTSLQQLTLQSGTVVISVLFEGQADTKPYQNLPGVTDATVKSGGQLLELTAAKTPDIRGDIFRLAVSRGEVIIGLEQSEQRLEDIFHALTSA
jgi:ABC-2 type transport system ATP-binding protein